MNKAKIPYPRMFTNKSSAALWMWKTSSRKRERQELLWRASFQRFSAVASVFSIPWHRIKPTSNTKKNKYKLKVLQTNSSGYNVTFCGWGNTLHHWIEFLSDSYYITYMCEYTYVYEQYIHIHTYIWFSKTGFLCVALHTVLELTL